MLDGLTLTLYEGELVSLLGANGAGKSTLLRTVAGLQPPLEGEILLGGKPMAKYGSRKLSKLISIVSTERTNAGGLTVRELVGLGRQPHTGFLGRLDDGDKAVVADAMQSVGIAHKAENFVTELSDGERQKAMIAKALAQESPIIILDEPTAFLDAVNRVEMLQLLHSLSREKRKSILLSSHDVAQSLALSDRLWLLSTDGKVESIVPEDAVLQGKMSALFGPGDVKFDTSTGEFVHVQEGGHEIAVSGEERLAHWCRNALRRNGFNIVGNCALRVDIASPAAIVLHYGDGQTSFPTVEKLIGYLIEKEDIWK